MYPTDFFQLFPPFPRNGNVFVAMSFDSRFQARWENVIQPAIREVKIGGVPLEPHRVDTRTVSDSILTEILNGISNDRLILADVTSLGRLDEYAIRNGNVMYEIGLAHSVRLPEEVLLFRSDSDRLLFDIAGVRVNHYDPDANPEEAKRKVAEVILDAVKEIDQRKLIAVKRALASLGHDGFLVLIQAAQGMTHPVVQTMRDVMSHAATRPAIARLLDMGLIATKYPSLDPTVPDPKLNMQIAASFRYHLTPLGAAVFSASAKELGLRPDNVSQWATVLGEDEAQAKIAEPAPAGNGLQPPATPKAHRSPDSAQTVDARRGQ